MMLIGINKLFTKAGLTVIQMPGWMSRSAQDGPFNPKGIMLHHDGMGLGFNKDPRDDLNVPKNMSKDNTNGSQIWISNKGVVALVAAGRTWHAGEGKGWGKIPKDRGNEFCVGVETDHYPGNPWPTLQLNAINLATKVMFDEYGFDTQYCCGHREYAPNRKADPERFDLNAWRDYLKDDGEMKASDILELRDAYYPTVNPGASVDRKMPVEEAIKTGFNYGSVATKEVKALTKRVAELEKIIATLRKS